MVSVCNAITLMAACAILVLLVLVLVAIVGYCVYLTARPKDHSYPPG